MSTCGDVRTRMDTCVHASTRMDTCIHANTRIDTRAHVHTRALTRARALDDSFKHMWTRTTQEYVVQDPPKECDKLMTEFDICFGNTPLSLKHIMSSIIVVKKVQN